MKTEKNLAFIAISGFALISFFVVFLLINPVIHYSEQQIAWLSGIHFFKYYLTYPGGLAEYFTLFISQFFYSGFIGSIIIALFPLLAIILLLKSLYLRLNTSFLPVDRKSTRLNSSHT